jgi:septin family protein
MSSNHSDLPALKSLLFECCFEGLKAGTEARFYSARESFLTTRALSKALSSGELPADLRSARYSTEA